MKSPDLPRLADQLRTLGLTTAEAKAYLALAKLGMGRVSEIASEAQLQRTEIYRLMQRLVARGVVEQMSDKPKSYKSSDFQKALAGLTQQAVDRLSKVKQESEQLLSSLQTLSENSNTSKNRVLRFSAARTK